MNKSKISRMTQQKLPLVPMSSPMITPQDRKIVGDVLDTVDLSMGPRTTEFENAFLKVTGRKFALACSSGTTGLHLCVRACGFSSGDYVITTPFSFVSSTNVLLYENATPIFVDVDPRSGNIDVSLVQQAAADLAGGNINRWLPRRGSPSKGHLAGLLAVDVFGQPADFDPLNQIAKKYDLKVIEDSCEALGAGYKGRPAGTLGEFGTFAFYPNKQITTGEGGMIVTDDETAANFMRALCNQGRAPGDTWLQHTYLGYNYRLDEMSAALGVSQMKRLEQHLTARQQVADWYNQRLQSVAGVEIPSILPETTRVSWFVYVIRVDKAIDRDTFAERLGQAGIPVRPYFLPIHLQPYMAEKFGYRPGDFPVTEDLGKRGLALPFSSVMSEAQVEIVCQTLKETL